MGVVLAIVGWFFFGLVILIGLALNLVGLFGNWVILAAIGGLWALTGFEHFGPWVLAAMVAMAAFAEVMEAIAAGFGAKRFGGGKGAMAMAIVGGVAGGIIGTPWLPLVGTMVGACVGAFIGAAAYEYLMLERKPGEAMRTGMGASLGKIAGAVAKTAVGLAILVLAALTY